MTKDRIMDGLDAEAVAVSDTGTIWGAVALERLRAHHKHQGDSMESAPLLDGGKRLRVLVEEVGEVAKAFNDYDHDVAVMRRDSMLWDDISSVQTYIDARFDQLREEVKKECIQVAAMAGAWAAVL
jgi:hypothetical protein